MIFSVQESIIDVGLPVKESSTVRFPYSGDSICSDNK